MSYLFNLIHEQKNLTAQFRNLFGKPFDIKKEVAIITELTRKIEELHKETEELLIAVRRYDSRCIKCGVDVPCGDFCNPCFSEQVKKLSGSLAITDEDRDDHVKGDCLDE